MKNLAKKNIYWIAAALRAGNPEFKHGKALENNILREIKKSKKDPKTSRWHIIVDQILESDDETIFNTFKNAIVAYLLGIQSSSKKKLSSRLNGMKGGRPKTKKTTRHKAKKA